MTTDTFQPWWKRQLRKHWKWLTFGLIVFVLGWCSGQGTSSGTSDPHAGHNHAPASQSSAAAPKKKTIWTCSMHPQIRLPKAGKCPICFMDLTPLQDDGGEKNPRKLAISEATKALAEIRTSKVMRRPVSMAVRMVGKVAYDETLVKTITAWVPGRLERMYVDYTGVRVRRGDHLVKIYSPDLLASQQELLQALKAWKQAQTGSRLTRQTARLGLEAARRKLSLLGLREWQIRNIEKRGAPLERINIYAPLGGIVIEKKAMEGMYVKTGTHLYTIADLSKVWLKFDAFERDLPWLHVGQSVTFQTLAMPGHSFTGKIVYIDPVLNSKTRTVSVRVNADNKDGLLKPEMFVKGSVMVSLNAKGRARPPEREGRYVCPMHPEVVSKRRSRCTICGMRLERIKAKKQGDDRDPLVIPATAPLLTGKRAVVYVEVPKSKKPTYEGREVTLGAQAGDYYVVRKGLTEGEEVVTHGAFRIDSELQLQARPSMMSLSSPEKKNDFGVDSSRPKLAHKRLKLLTPIYKSYFAVSQALTKDNPKATLQALRTLKRRIQALTVLKGNARERWARRRSPLFTAVSRNLRQTKIADLRRLFETLSHEVIELERTIGHAGMKAYYLTYCPMAFNNRGAYWLQDKKDVRNPYFGKSMLVCGSTKATYAGRDAEPVQPPKRFLRSLSRLYKPYFGLQHALFKDDLKTSWQELKRFQKALGQRRRGLLPFAMRRRWLLLRKTLQEGVTKAKKKKDIEVIRKGFYDISRGMLQLVFVFGHVEKTPVYETYCPMAFNNTGAAWLQPQDKQVRNSYFGAKMAFCGTVKRRFSSRLQSTSSTPQK
ncbi:MAG: DUF3347 domain-containing protein [Deltaproteobacteria bacterium]|nr:MAG: DUF3347 domain-containing protein [Deltaproteobacteria bacterium]